MQEDVLAISLCAGVGGLDLGFHQAWKNIRTVAYVEFDPFCQDILLRRMDDGRLDRAPIYPDLRTFDGTAWCGLVDLVYGGPPCQPFSVAGTRRGAGDPRNLIPDTLRVIRECRPAVVFLENVSGALPYFFHDVLPELHGMGYTTQTRLVTAAEVGAPHKRQRIFVLAHREGVVGGLSVRCPQKSDSESGRGSSVLATTQGNRLEGRATLGESGRETITRRGSSLAHARRTERGAGQEAGAIPPWPPGPSERDQWAAILARWPELAPAVADTKRPEIHQAAATRKQRTKRGTTADSGANGKSETSP